jgi:hypothetical protein
VDHDGRMWFLITRSKHMTVEEKKKKTPRSILVNSELYPIIRESFEKFPRTHLFINNRKEPMSKPTYDSFIKLATNNPNDSINTLRSNYWSYYAKDHFTNTATKEEIAQNMMTSVSTANENYLKDRDYKPRGVLPELDTHVQPIGRPKLDPVDKMTNDRAEYDHERYMLKREAELTRIREYNRENRADVYRNKFIRKLRAGEYVKPSTLKTYNINPEEYK